MKINERSAEMNMSTGDIKLRKLQEDIVDLQRCLAGNPISNMWQLLQIDLNNKRLQLEKIVERSHHNALPANKLIKDPMSGFWISPPK